jgi:predicted NAD/FAD-binding protein
VWPIAPRCVRTCDLIASQHPNFPIREDRIELDVVLRTPIFDFQSCASTARLPALNGVQNTYFCGAETHNSGGTVAVL